MTGGDPMMPPDLDRLLAGATVPDMSAGLIDRIVAEAARPGRTALPVARSPRSRGRRWTRRGVWSGVVAVNLMLATAVAAAFGGGGLTFAKIATVAHHVVERIRAPFHHADHHAAPVRPAAVHRLAVPAAAIMTAPPIVLPMMAPRSLADAPVVVRPRFQPAMPVRGMAHPVRSPPVDRARPFAAAGPRPVVHAASHPRLHETGRDPVRHAVAHRGEGFRPHPFRAPRSEPRTPMAPPIGPRADPLPRAEGISGREAPNAERGLQADGGTRLDGPRWQAGAAARTDGRADDRAGMGGQGQDRSPGWRRRMQGENPGGGAPGWRRRAGGLGGAGAGRPGGRMKPPRPVGGGRRPRRF